VNLAPKEVVAVFEKVRKVDGADGKRLSQTLRKTRAKTEEHESAAILKTLARVRHGVRMGTCALQLFRCQRTTSPGGVLKFTGARQ
jgi:dihydrodipicolinate synthase/N-acetylneuraminate lyase